MKYQELEPISKIQAEAIFASQNATEIGPTLLRLSHDCNDWRWVQFKCLYYLENGDNHLKLTAILSLGHIARIHHQLDTAIVLPILINLRNDVTLQGRVEDTLDDIAVYLKSSDAI